MEYSTIAMIVLMIVAFYFLILRPQKKRQQAQQQTLNSIIPGARVLLGSGVFGTVTEMGEKQAVLELSPGVHLTVLKQAISRVVKEGDEDTEWLTFNEDGSVAETESAEAEADTDAGETPSEDEFFSKDADASSEGAEPTNAEIADAEIADGEAVEDLAPNDPRLEVPDASAPESPSAPETGSNPSAPKE